MTNILPFPCLDTSEASEMTKCFMPVLRTFDKGDTILDMTDDEDLSGIMLSGMALLERSDVDGQTSIIEYYEKNEIFCKRLAPKSECCSFYVVANSRCEVMFVSYKKLITCCNHGCDKHVRLIDNLIYQTTHKAQVHIDILSRRTTRQKLTAYFEYEKKRRNSNEFKVPLSLSELSQYLSVDRSAMMREIKKMNEEEIIISKGSRFTLLT